MKGDLTTFPKAKVLQKSYLHLSVKIRVLKIFDGELKSGEDTFFQDERQRKRFYPYR